MSFKVENYIIKALALNVLLFSGPDNYRADISNDVGVTDTLVSAEFEVISYCLIMDNGLTRCDSE